MKKIILTLSCWYSLESSRWVLSDEYPFAMVSWFLSFSSSFRVDQISQQQPKGKYNTANMNREQTQCTSIPTFVFFRKQCTVNDRCCKKGRGTVKQAVHLFWDLQGPCMPSVHQYWKELMSVQNPNPDDHAIKNIWSTWLEQLAPLCTISLHTLEIFFYLLQKIIITQNSTFKTKDTDYY